MATQGILPFPCRKPRVFSPKSNVRTSVNSPKKPNSNPRKTLMSVSNLPNTGFNLCARSIMSQPKSPRKRYGDPAEGLENWSNDELLHEIFKLSPCSPIKPSREGPEGKIQRKHATPSKKRSPKPSSDFTSPTHAILSPIRALSLNSPPKPEAKAIDSKRTKVLQLKLAKIDISHDDNFARLPPDETPTRPTRNRNKAVTFSTKKASRKLLTDKTPQKEVIPRRVTRSAKKLQKTKIFDDTEDDFKENIAPGALMPSPNKKPKTSPEKERCSPLRSAILPPSSAKAETPSKSPKKVLTPEKPQLSPAKCLIKSANGDRATTPRARRVLQLHKPDALVYQQTKQALHSSVPDELIGRESEIAQISDFVSSGVKSKKSGSLYISGAPGTGKSACLMKVLNNDAVTRVSSSKSKVISVNCMSMRNATAIYSKIASDLGAKPSNCKTTRLSMKYLEKTLTSEGPSVILLLDEMDQLDSKNQEVLYTIFEWPALENSRLLLIGIANALDLTDRILPRLQSRTKCKPTLINFQPYTKDQIVSILEGRIKQTSSNGERVIDPMAVQFCARKVSAVAGDARKALDICRRAVEVVETGVKSQHVLSPSGKPNGVNPLPKKVGLQQIAGVLSGIYESSILPKKTSISTANDRDEEETFPLQQKLAICTLILLSKHVKSKEVTLGKLHESYAKVCKKRQVTAVGQSEFSSLLQLVETRGIVCTKPNKQMRMMKVSLALQEKDVEYALQDKTLLSAILQEGLPK